MAIASKIKATKAALDFLDKFYLADPSEINLNDILGAERIMYQERYIKSALGNLIRHKNSGRILINSTIKSNQQKRFIISHELGHWCMHKDFSVFNCESNKFKVWSKEISNIEKEANWFASEFLMPTNKVKSFIASESISIEQLINTSERFNTSITATAIKLADVGNEPAMIVYSVNKRVTWFYPSKDFCFSFYDKQFTIPPNSVTETAYSTLIVDKKDVVKAIDWFPRDHSVKPDQYLYELAIPMKNFNACLTILWQHELNFENN